MKWAVLKIIFSQASRMWSFTVEVCNLSEWVINHRASDLLRELLQSLVETQTDILFCFVYKIKLYFILLFYFLQMLSQFIINRWIVMKSWILYIDGEIVCQTCSAGISMKRMMYKRWGLAVTNFHSSSCYSHSWAFCHIVWLKLPQWELAIYW